MSNGQDRKNQSAFFNDGLLGDYNKDDRKCQNCDQLKSKCHCGTQNPKPHDPESLSFEEYEAIAKIIINYLRDKDAKDDKNNTKNDIINWFIEEDCDNDSQVKIETVIC